MQSGIRTGANLILKIGYETGTGAPEKTIGYCTNVSFNVTNGQKAIFTVDSPFPQELAQGAAPSMVNGSMVLYMLKGTDPVKAGLIPPTNQQALYPQQIGSKYCHLRFYDRFTYEKAFEIQYVKVKDWSMTVAAKQIVMGQLRFEGFYYEVGTS